MTIPRKPAGVRERSRFARMRDAKMPVAGTRMKPAAGQERRMQENGGYMRGRGCVPVPGQEASGYPEKPGSGFGAVVAR